MLRTKHLALVLSLGIFQAAAALGQVDWKAQAARDAREDVVRVVFDGQKPNSMVCDTTLRELPDGSWELLMLAGGDTEPSPKNYTAISRSTDQGKTWTPPVPLNVGLPREGKTIGQGPTELMVLGGRCTLFFSTHSRHWNNDWRSWIIHSDDSCRSWSKPEPVPGRLARPDLPAQPPRHARRPYPRALPALSRSRGHESSQRRADEP